MARRLDPTPRRLLLAMLATCACATPLEVPIDDREFAAQQAILGGFQERRARVRDIGFQLRSRGRPFCGGFLLRDAGLLLGEPRGGDGRLDAMITGALGLRSGINVLHVARAAPLAEQDVRGGDVLVALDGTPVATIAEYTEALASMAGADATFTFEREGERIDVRAAVPLTCGVPINFSRDMSLMTFQSELTVAVPFGLLEVTDDDDALAIAIAHQMAHVLTEFASNPVRDVEAAADRLGLLLAAEAGFDVTKAPEFWAWLASEDPWRIDRYGGFRVPRPHPTRVGVEITYATNQLHIGIASRLPAIRQTVAEILAFRARAQAENTPPSAD